MQALLNTYAVNCLQIKIIMIKNTFKICFAICLSILTLTAYAASMLDGFIARRFGLHVGFDIAKGPKDTAFYLTPGHAWR